MARINKRYIWLLLLFLVALLSSYLLLNRMPTPVSKVFFVMDTVAEYKLYGKNAEQVGVEIEKILVDIEHRMSMHQPDSEISKLNQNAGKAFTALSPDTFSLLARSVGFGNISQGVFDITIAPLATFWNITSEHPSIPSSQQLAELLPLVDYNDILLNGEQYTAQLRQQGQAVDLGGVAKGYACEQAYRIAKQQGVSAGYLSIGGNIMVLGKKPDGKPFRFGVRDPQGGESDYFAVVMLEDTTMSTSGGYERYFEQDGVRYHHILDTKTGYPVQTDLLSVSVITPDGAYADFMSTYLFVMGVDFVREHLDSLDCEVIAVDNQHNVYISPSLNERFEIKENSVYHLA